jgi:hypothetical protein
MSALPVYQVEFIPLERRLGDRRVAPRGAALPPGITADRRKVSGRRIEERKSADLKVVCFSIGCCGHVAPLQQLALPFLLLKPMLAFGRHHLPLVSPHQIPNTLLPICGTWHFALPYDGHACSSSCIWRKCSDGPF